MDDRSSQVWAVCIPFVVLTCIAVSLRLYTRCSLTRAVGADDWTMIVAQAAFLFYMSCEMGGLIHGTGKHHKDLSPDNLRKALRFWWLCELSYIVAAALVKVSVGIFLHRIAVKRIHLWILRLLIIGTAVFGSAYFALGVLQCRPVSVWWEDIVLHGTYKGDSRCLSPELAVNLTYLASAINASADWTFALLPIFIVKDLNMPRKQKVLVAFILALGALGSAATVVRIPYIHNLANLEDFLWATTDVAIWSTVEPGLAIVAGSLATLRPLLSHLLQCCGRASLSGNQPLPDIARDGDHFTRRPQLSPKPTYPYPPSTSNSNSNSNNNSYSKSKSFVSAKSVPDELGSLRPDIGTGKTHGLGNVTTITANVLPLTPAEAALRDESGYSNMNNLTGLTRSKTWSSANCAISRWRQNWNEQFPWIEPRVEARVSRDAPPPTEGGINKRVVVESRYSEHNTPEPPPPIAMPIPNRAGLLADRAGLTPSPAEKRSGLFRSASTGSAIVESPRGSYNGRRSASRMSSGLVAREFDSGSPIGVARGSGEMEMPTRGSRNGVVARDGGPGVGAGSRFVFGQASRDAFDSRRTTPMEDLAWLSDFETKLGRL